MSILTEVERLTSAKENLKQAINAKGGTLVNEKLDAYAEAVDALVPEEFGSRVRFIDYDGTILKTVYIADGESVTTPELPVHPGMVFQGWNCDTENIIGHCDIGAIYTTESGACEFDVKMEVPTGYTVRFYPYIESGTLTIDWGDGTVDTVSSTGKQEVSYTYAEYGECTVKMKISDGGSWYIPDYFCNGSNSNYYLIRARITGVKKLNNYAFQYQYGLQTVTLSRDIESMGEQIFYENRSLVAFVFPDSLTSISRNTFYYCYGLARVVFPDTITEIPEYLCYYCYTLDGVTIPNGVTTINSYAFYCCWALKYVRFPSTLTHINYEAFRDCYSLRDVKFPEGLLYLGDRAFYNNYALGDIHLPDSITSMGSELFAYNRAMRHINIPAGVTSIPNYFCHCCYGLESIEIPENITYIGDQAFRDCYCLKNVTFHSGITNIRSRAFGYCYSMQNYYCKRTTPPTLGSSNVFDSIPASCTIWVPASTDRTVLTAYKTASNWSNYANYMKEKEY